MINANASTIADELWLTALKEGDVEAWDHFADLYSVKLYEYLRHLLPTEEIVADLLSEILLATVQAIHQFHHDVSLNTWVYSIAYRKVADYWRRRQTTLQRGRLATLSDPSLSALFEELPEQAQQAFLLRYYVGLPISEIAEVLGRSLKATESLLQRARQRIHELGHIDTTVPLAEERKTEPAPKFRTIFGTAYPLVLLQKRIALENGLRAEAAIFERAQQTMERLPAISNPDFSDASNQLSINVIEEILYWRLQLSNIASRSESHGPADSKT